jgi:hypothetical protein
MPKAFDKDVEKEYSDLLKACSDKTKIKVLIFGPNTDTNSSGSILREYIASSCKSPKVPVYAERKTLIKSYEKQIGKYSDFCDYEKKLAEFVDAIIIIPDSAGSLVELGMLAHETELHTKILVLFNKEYIKPNDPPSFIDIGPRKAYQIRRATISDVDYSDKGTILKIVEDFLDQRKAVIFSKKHLLM